MSDEIVKLNADAQVTAFAAIYDAGVPVNPLNRAVVYGSPGTELVANTSPGLWIFAPSLGYVPTYYFMLDSNGKASLALRYDGATQSTGAEDVSVMLTLSDRVSGLSQSYPVVTGDYRRSNEYGFAYNYTTGVPADGETVCSVYVVMLGANWRDMYTQVYASVDGSASIAGAPRGSEQGHTVPLSPQGGATVNITNTKEEKVRVVITLPESPDSDLASFTVQFLNPLVAN